MSDTTNSSNGGEGLFEGDDERGEGGGEAGAGGQRTENDPASGDLAASERELHHVHIL